MTSIDSNMTSIDSLRDSWFQRTKRKEAKISKQLPILTIRTTCKKQNNNLYNTKPPETMTMMMMIATAVLVLALSAAPSCEAKATRRLYRVQPNEKIMPSHIAASSPSSHADFERFDNDAKRALRELMTFPATRHLLSLDVISSMEYLSLSYAPIISLSYAPIMSMSPPPTMYPIDDADATTDIPVVVAAVNRVAGVGGENGKSQFNKPATISVTVFLLIAAMAVTALVVRKYKRAVLMAGGPDDQSILTGSVFSNIEPGRNIPTPV
jgi:hypothetical protein